MSQRPSTLPFMFATWEEFDAWHNDLHHELGKAEKMKEEVLLLQAQDLARKANNTGIPDAVRALIPAEVIDALKQVKRIEGFLPLLPDVEVPYWAAILVRYLSIVGTFFGV